MERQRGFAGEAVSLVGVEGGGGVFDVVSSWRPVGFMAVLLVALNFFDVAATFYGVGVLGFVELNSLAVGFPVWVFLLKFGVCFVPVVCAYAWRSLGWVSIWFCRLCFLLFWSGFMLLWLLSTWVPFSAHSLICVCV